MNDIALLIDELVNYGKDKLGLCLEDAIYARNQLGDLFSCVMNDVRADRGNLNEVISGLTSYALNKGIISEGEELRFETKLLGYVTPSAGLVKKTFEEKFAKSPKEATDYLYNLSINNKYIRLEDISRNIRWYADGPKGKIGITINLSKPEKDPKQIAAERNAPKTKYPKCLLCLENLGFPGTITHPARQTIRIVPLSLAKENWHMQYSPYMYYDEHIIAFADEHRPMAVTDKTFERLMDFVDIFPHYFLGSNADLPIVGGSILSHDHYQGGKKVLPMFLSKVRKEFYNDGKLSVSIKDWYNSVVTVRGKDKAKVHAMASKVLATWRNYTDESVGIYAFTGDTPHNTVTPIVTKWDGEYCVDIILRNNRTDDAHPDGIFHPTKDMHNIKKEGIGLIEAMGLFILPGRLKKEIAAMISLLGQDKIDFAAVNEDETLSKHVGMIAQIAAINGCGLSADKAQQVIIDYVNDTCLKILECTAVFKNNASGQEAFERFVKTVLK